MVAKTPTVTKKRVKIIISQDAMVSAPFVGPTYSSASSICLRTHEYRRDRARRLTFLGRQLKL
jgi:hypothetical protein